MRANAMRRLAKIEDAVRTMPLSDALVTNAFDAFRATGELPEHDGLAAAVVDRAVNGDAAGRFGSLVTYINELGHAVRVSVRVCTHPPEPRPVPPRELLFHEAVHGQIDVKMAARKALTELVAAGADVSDPTWLMRHPVPEFGSLGMSLLGWPDKAVVAPYETQGKRLLARIEAFQERTAHLPEPWFEALERAVQEFHDRGDLPPNELVRDAVLANAELYALMRHYLGDDVDAELAALDRIHQELKGGTP